jgi:hypothetical protein
MRSHRAQMNSTLSTIRVNESPLRLLTMNLCIRLTLYLPNAWAHRKLVARWIA